MTVELDPEDPTAGRMVLGISAPDRPGLLHDISQGLNRLQVQLLHCEASAVAGRSVSIWRLQVIKEETTREEISTVIDALLAPATGADAAKKKGVSVLRAQSPVQIGARRQDGGRGQLCTGTRRVRGRDASRAAAAPSQDAAPALPRTTVLARARAESDEGSSARARKDLQSAVDGALARARAAQVEFRRRRARRPPSFAATPWPTARAEAEEAASNAARCRGSRARGARRKKSVGGGMEEMDAATRTISDAPRDVARRARRPTAEPEARRRAREVDHLARPDTHAVSDAATAAAAAPPRSAERGEGARGGGGAKEAAAASAARARGAREFEAETTAEDAAAGARKRAVPPGVGGALRGGGGRAACCVRPRRHPAAQAAVRARNVGGPSDERAAGARESFVRGRDASSDCGARARARATPRPIRCRRRDDVLRGTRATRAGAMIRRSTAAAVRTDEVDKLNANSRMPLDQRRGGQDRALVGESRRHQAGRASCNARVLAVAQGGRKGARQDRGSRPAPPGRVRGGRRAVAAPPAGSPAAAAARACPS